MDCELSGWLVYLVSIELLVDEDVSPCAGDHGERELIAGWLDVCCCVRVTDPSWRRDETL